jgi:hypothetical protein
MAGEGRRTGAAHATRRHAPTLAPNPTASARVASPRWRSSGGLSVVSTAMRLEELLEQPPRLHVDRHGKLTSWRASDALLRCIDSHLRPGMSTLETGAGVSSILFAMRGCRHIAVAPDISQAERIRAWCRSHDIPTDDLSFVTEPSETALPAMPREPLDVVLIDGAHGFPTPFIDWYYAGLRVDVGGVVIIDDTQIWTGRVLRDFLAADESWALEEERRLEFVAFRRSALRPVGEWTDQSYVLRRSFTANSPHPGRRTVGRAVASGRRVVAGLELLRKGDLATLRQRLRG